MGLFSTLDISASGLKAEKARMTLIAENVANIDTTRTVEGGPYRRKIACFREIFSQELRGANKKGGKGTGVELARVIKDETPPILVYDPQHPDASPEGFVAKPNIQISNEMVDLITASRAYEANATVMNTTKSIALKTLNIGRE